MIDEEGGGNILYKLKWQFPLAFISLVLLAFLMEFLVRFTLGLTQIITSAGLKKTDSINIVMKIMISLGEKFKQTAINYFVYQAKQVQIKVLSQRFEDYKIREARYHALFLWLFISFFIFEIIDFTYFIFEMTNNLGLFSEKTQALFFEINKASVMVILSINTVFYLIFMPIVMFYIERRSAKMEEDGDD